MTLAPGSPAVPAFVADKELFLKRIPSFVLATLAVLAALGLPARATQEVAVVDTSRLGPQVGSPAPPFTGTDQAGRSQSLEAARGAKGTMLVFFRSADW